ncbi:MAG TPA: hypothetical protein VF703_10220 [Pyrinomonadaceae bacterium]|jgi:hypothetical protein
MAIVIPRAARLNNVSGGTPALFKVIYEVGSGACGGRARMSLMAKRKDGSAWDGRPATRARAAATRAEVLESIRYKARELRAKIQSQNAATPRIVPRCYAARRRDSLFAHVRGGLATTQRRRLARAIIKEV